LASAKNAMAEIDDDEFIKEFVSTKKDADDKTTSKVRLRQNALMKYKREFSNAPLTRMTVPVSRSVDRWMEGRV